MAARPHATCHLCGSQGLASFYRVERVPVRSIVLCHTREAALGWPTGTLDLVACPHCGFIQNDAYDPSLQDFSVPAEETQGFSPKFRQFARALAEDLAQRYPLAGKRIVEIGCGRGEFLAMACAAAGARGIGLDPAWRRERHAGPVPAHLTFIGDRFEDHLDQVRRADLVVCRHTLEHIQPVRHFITTLRQALAGGSGAPVVFEVPESGRILDEHAFWDVYYEHCSYFTASSLEHLFHCSGFAVTGSRTEFDGQYLITEAQPGAETAGGAPPAPGDTLPRARSFAAGVSRVIQEWRQLLQRYRQAGKRVVVWGSGSKAVAFLSVLAEMADGIDYVVDINPHKQGTWSPGTGHPIVGPDAVGQRCPDLVVVMNPIYLGEIQAEVQARGVAAEYLALGAAAHPPLQVVNGPPRHE